MLAYPDTELVVFRLNGHDVRLEGLPFETTLLQFIRMHGLTATKEGCAEGDCGACTVAILEPSPDGRNRYRAVNSCLMLAPMAAGLEVWTAEGLADGELLHPAQQEMASRGGSQCGFCTPGFVMSLFTEFYREGRVQDDGQGDGFDESALVGNLCRCTGYRPIRDVANAMPRPAPDDPFIERARKAKAVRHTLVYDGFYRPSTIEGAVSLLAAMDQARVIAGGTDMALEVTTGFKRLGPVVSVDTIPELHIVIDTPETLEIGAAVPLSRIENEYGGIVPLLDELWPWFASRQIRNRATLGGNLGTASPIGDASVVLLALEADVVLFGTHGERTVPMASFFTSYRQTALEHGELIKAVRIAKRRPPGTLRRFEAAYKIAKRGHDDISTVMAAFVVHIGEDNRVLRARLAYGGVAATPRRALETERVLEGQIWNREVINQAKAVLRTEFQPITDFRASRAYRERVVVNLLEKFFLEHDELEPEPPPGNEGAQ
jgi:xanthine dehydrogenase small subunit